MSDVILVTLVHENENLETVLSAAQVEEISSDPQKYEDLVNKLLEEKAQDKENINLANENIGDQQNDDFPKAGTSGTNNQGNESKWTHESVLLLLDLRLGMETDFNRPVCKKAKLWQQISEKMRLLGNYIISGQNCDTKYRNLLQTYRSNKDKRLKMTGEAKITWEYYDIFDCVLGHKASSAPPEKLLGSTTSFPNKDNEEVTEVERTPKRFKRDTKSWEEQKEKELSLQQFLFLKNEREIRELELRKELKEKEINAINNLAEAIKSTRNN